MPGAADAALSTPLSDEAFWALSTRLSEPAGEFTHSDNLVSNEIQFVHIVRLLPRTGGVYLGVGPEQNFSYIARLAPAMAFIVDIREENRNLQLMYKALFEVSSDRADFVFRLFSRDRPAGVDEETSVDDLFRALAAAEPSAPRREETSRLIRERLVDVHRWPLTTRDLEWIDYLLDAFRAQGPDIHYYGRSRPAGSVDAPSYRALMTVADIFGASHSYLASDEGFQYVKHLQARNLVVPVVGDFAGSTAIRQTGEYVRARGARVTAFYGSNVEVYLDKEETTAFCANLAALPFDSRARFIDAKGTKPMAAKLGTCVPRRGVFVR